MSLYNVILHPTDFSEASDRAFQLACSVARDHSASLVVVHVLLPNRFPNCETEADLIRDGGPIISDCRERFRQMASQATGISISFRIVPGYAVGAILRVASEDHADLIVIASQQKNRIQLQLHGSVAEGVLRQSHCPVICLRDAIKSPASAPLPAASANEPKASGNASSRITQ